ncbi:hypothetical protein Btru_049102 [Bulinus truncatus]|nr:hypothetical protein Btru_049102 [Bulinus truncatus]
MDEDFTETRTCNQHFAYYGSEHMVIDSVGLVLKVSCVVHKYKLIDVHIVQIGKNFFGESSDVRRIQQTSGTGGQSSKLQALAVSLADIRLPAVPPRLTRYLTRGRVMSADAPSCCGSLSPSQSETPQHASNEVTGGPHHVAGVTGGPHYVAGVTGGPIMCWCDWQSTSCGWCDWGPHHVAGVTGGPIMWLVLLAARIMWLVGSRMHISCPRRSC